MIAHRTVPFYLNFIGEYSIQEVLAISVIAEYFSMMLPWEDFSRDKRRIASLEEHLSRLLFFWDIYTAEEIFNSLVKKGVIELFLIEKRVYFTFNFFLYPLFVGYYMDERTKKHNHEFDKLKKQLRKDSACCFCGKKETLNVHHIVPESCGGDNDPLNLIVLCRKHHLNVHTAYRKSAEKTKEYFINTFNKIKDEHQVNNKI